MLIIIIIIIIVTISSQIILDQSCYHYGVLSGDGAQLSSLHHLARVFPALNSACVSILAWHFLVTVPAAWCLPRSQQ